MTRSAAYQRGGMRPYPSASEVTCAAGRGEREGATERGKKRSAPRALPTFWGGASLIDRTRASGRRRSFSFYLIPLPLSPVCVCVGLSPSLYPFAMVFESVVADLLNRFLGDYVENLNKSQLKLGIWGGKGRRGGGKEKVAALAPLTCPLTGELWKGWKRRGWGVGGVASL